ncbi:MAG: hypothetical protein LBT10_06755 [Methanobrevibacter sp.]|nr:hypothetical protein [Methanobrevibacter sp.]
MYSRAYFFYHEYERYGKSKEWYRRDFDDRIDMHTLLYEEPANLDYDTTFNLIYDLTGLDEVRTEADIFFFFDKLKDACNIRRYNNDFRISVDIDIDNYPVVDFNLRVRFMVDKFVDLYKLEEFHDLSYYYELLENDCVRFNDLVLKIIMASVDTGEDDFGHCSFDIDELYKTYHYQKLSYKNDLASEKREKYQRNFSIDFDV